MISLRILPFLIVGITAATAAEPKTLLAQPGANLLSDDLKTAPDGKEWKAAKGKWEIADGALRAAELPADKHGAVSRRPLKFTDAVIQYEVKIEGAKGTTLSINDAKGHNCRVSINAAGFSVTKDDHDHEGPDKAVAFGRRALTLKPGEWHTVRMEVVGDTVLGTVDDAPPVFGSHEMIAVEKTNFGLTVAGESASFRNLKVWAAQPNPAWEKTKATIPAPLPPARPAAKKAAAN